MGVINSKEIIEPELNRIWTTYIDLLFLRETAQNKLYGLRKDKDGERFIEEQLTLSDRLIKSANPRLIIVCNAYGSGIFCTRNRITEETFDDSIGTYRWNGIPVFLTSMLTGGAMDKGSFDRLKWQIKRTLAFVNRISNS